MVEIVFQAAKIKGCEKLVQWIEPVRNHFWHCAETCDGDIELLKVMLFWCVGSHVECTVLEVVVSFVLFLSSGQVAGDCPSCLWGARVGWWMLLSWTSNRNGRWQGVLGNELESSERAEEDSARSRVDEKSAQLCLVQVHLRCCCCRVVFPGGGGYSLCMCMYCRDYKWHFLGTWVNTL